MDEELKLLIRHSNVLTNEDIKELKDSDIPDKFKGISLVKIYKGEEDFKPFNKLIHTLNLFFTYDMDLYEELLDFLVKEYVLKLNHNAITLKETLHPVMMGIKKKLNSEGLSNYLFTGNPVNLEPYDIFRSVEILSTASKHFQREVFTSKVVAKGLSFINTKEELEVMFTHLTSYPFDMVREDLVKAAIDRNNVTFLDYLITEDKDKINDESHESYIYYSIDNNSLACFKRLLEFNGFKGIDIHDLCNYVSFHDRLDFLKYLYEHGGSEFCDKDTCNSAAEGGGLNCLKYLYENGGPTIWSEELCSISAENGHLNCLKYYHEKTGTLDEDVCHNASSNGHLDCLKYAYENRGPEIWISMISSNAAYGGHINCLKYIHEQEGFIVWNDDICIDSAKGGHLDCLKYAHENGCPWGNMTNNIPNNINSKCLQYAIGHGCPH